MLEKDLEDQGCGWQPKSYIHTSKPQIQNVELRKGRLGIRTIPCIFGEEKNQVPLMCFVCVCVCVCVWKRGEKFKIRPSREQDLGSLILFIYLFIFWFGGCLGPFITTTRIMRRRLKGHHLQMVLDGVDLDTPGKILISSF